MTDRGRDHSTIQASTRRSVDATLYILVFIYLLLGVIYSTSLPILEAPDEMWHYAYVRYLVREHRLPPWDTESPVGQESSQPPLYYVAAAAATAGIDASRPSTFLDRNPHWGYASAGTVNDNKNLFFHQRGGAEAFPWQDTALAVHVARLTNLAFGALTVVFAYLLAREVFSKHPFLITSATAVVAFSPQFLFISAAVNNDTATSAFSTLTLWLLVRGLRRGFTPSGAVILGSSAGLAALSKVSALALVPLTLVAIGLRSWFIRDQREGEAAGGSSDRESPRWRESLLHGSLFLTVVLAVSGWWYIRNAALYGDPFGLGTHLETWWAHEEPLSLAHVWTQLPSIELSYWAAFGWGNVHLPRAFYIMMRIAARLALVGLVAWAVRMWQARDPSHPLIWSMALLALWVLMVFAALLRWMQLVEAALGRLLFPAIGAIAVLTTWGLTQLSVQLTCFQSRPPGVGRRIARFTLTVLAGWLFFAAVASPFAAIRPAYARPPLLSDEEIASRTTPTTIRFGESIQLVGFDLEPESAQPGEQVSTTLCWEALAPMTKNYAYFVHLLGPNDTIVGARDTHPGLGRFPTSQWKPDISFCDTVRVPVGENTPVPAVYDVEIGWYNPETDQRLPAYSAEGAPIELVTVGTIEIVSGVPLSVEVPNHVEANVGDSLTLLGYGIDDAGLQVTAGQAVSITLYWKARSSPAADYTVFVHLTDASLAPHTQDDGQPRDGTYPTSYWDRGQVVTDTHLLSIPDDLPPGRYDLVSGMYLLETGRRLAAVDASGERLPADAVPLTEVHILP